MKESIRHLLLIFGSIAIAMGVMLFVFSETTRFKYLVSSLVFVSGCYLIMRTLSGTSKIKRRDVEVKKKMLENRKDKKE